MNVQFSNSDKTKSIHTLLSIEEDDGIQWHADDLEPVWRLFLDAAFDEVVPDSPSAPTLALGAGGPASNPKGSSAPSHKSNSPPNCRRNSGPSALKNTVIGRMKTAPR